MAGSGRPHSLWTPNQGSTLRCWAVRPHSSIPPALVLSLIHSTNLCSDQTQWPGPLTLPLTHPGGRGAALFLRCLAHALRPTDVSASDQGPSAPSGSGGEEGACSIPWRPHCEEQPHPGVPGSGLLHRNTGSKTQRTTQPTTEVAPSHSRVNQIRTGRQAGSAAAAAPCSGCGGLWLCLTPRLSMGLRRAHSARGPGGDIPWPCEN